MKIDGRKNSTLARERALKYKFKPPITPKNNLLGKVFDFWTVIDEAPSRFGHKTYWLCRCRCGKIKEIAAQSLLNGSSTKCMKCRKSTGNSTHGFCKNGKKPLEYHIWNSIKNRCKNPNIPGYKNYGGRGITICKEWDECFEKFLDDMGVKPFKDASVERIDNEKGYSKENCKWIKRIHQMKNTRKSPLINGKRVCISDLAKEINRCRFWVSSQLKKGISLEDLRDMDGPVFKYYYSIENDV